jgi:hypothetical protein
MHRLIESPRTFNVPQPRRSALQTKETPRADTDTIVAVYADLLRLHLVLSEEHRLQLRARGLDDLSIGVNGYVSVPSPLFAIYVTRALAHDHDLRGVPGFYRDGSVWRMVDYGAGFFIPSRGSDGRIRALMVRRDEGKSSDKYLWFSSNGRTDGGASGAPVNHAKAHLLKEATSVTIAEGVLKADVTAHLLNQPVVGNAPSCFGADFAANLKAEFPKLRTIFVAFDMDMERKEHVRHALFRLVKQLEEARFDVRVRTWSPEWKGIDDYLLAISQREVAA